MVACLTFSSASNLPFNKGGDPYWSLILKGQFCYAGNAKYNFLYLLLFINMGKQEEINWEKISTIIPSLVIL
jgi:hypothetical protein